MLRKKICAFFWLCLFVAGLGGCGAGDVTVTPKPKTLALISVTPMNAAIAKNTGQQFSATGIYSDTTTQDMTAAVLWSSSDTTTALVDASGNVIAKKAGNVIIKALYGGLSDESMLNITDATLVSITVTPTNPGIAKGTKQQFTATGIFSDYTTQNLTNVVTWSSSGAGVATISNAAGSNGMATSAAAGTTTITATSGSLSGSTVLTVTGATLVSLAVTPTNPSIAKGTKRQFTATGTYSDNTTQNLTNAVTWSSSSAGVATISNTAGSNGSATSVATGTTTITATSGSLSGSTALTVTAASLVSISVTPTNPSIAKGTTQQFTATGTYSDNTTQNLTTAAIWSSSSAGVATISNAAGSNGMTTSVAAGTTTITATSGSVSGSTALTVTGAALVSLTVSPTNPSIAKGTKQQFTATGTYADSTTQNLTNAVTWSSSSAGVATISNAAGSKGLATSVAAGTTTITATSGSVSGSTALTVTAATLTSIAVTPQNPSIANGTTQQFKATGTYSDTTTQDLTDSATWSSSSAGVATISNAAGSKGLAAAITAGPTTITSASGSVSGTTMLTVTEIAVVTLTWDAPTTNEDGSPVTLSGYKIYYGTLPGTYSNSVSVSGAGATPVTYTLSLSPGTYYFAVTAISADGQESAYSNEISKTI